MKTINELQIKTKLDISTNLQFLIFKNYLLSISYEKNTIDFYDMKTFIKKFYIKPEGYKNIFYNEEWMLFYTKKHKLFLLQYENEMIYESNINEKPKNELNIYSLEIDNRKCIKKKSFIYYQFIQDKNDDKLYIITNKSIIKYDFITGSSTEKNITNENFTKGSSSKLFFVDNCFVSFYIQLVSDWTFLLLLDIEDKNLEYSKKYLSVPSVCFNEGDVTMDNCVQITNNLFTVFSGENNQTTEVKFAELRIEEKLLKENNLEKDKLFNIKEINIKETGKMNIYPINNEKCGFVFNNKKYYICNLSKMEIYLKIELDINDKLLLLKFVDSNGKYKLYLNNKGKLLFISS